jgi:hydroxyacylglutathione hydrolase
LGAIPTTTVGYEKLFNPSLQYYDEQEFVDYILADQPETPFYFAVMKHVNKVGPALLRNLPPVHAVAASQLLQEAKDNLVVDTRSSSQFAKHHVPSTINVPSSSLVQWAGFFVDYKKPLLLLTDPKSLADDLRGLRSIGIDHVKGYFDVNSPETVQLMTESYPSESPIQLRSRIESGAVALIDVRAATEFHEGHIAGAEHRFLGKLLRELKSIDPSKPIVVQCLGGGRSAIASSVLQRAGYEVINMEGGYRAWTGANLPTTPTRSVALPV